MTDKKPSELTNEALIKTEKNLKILISIFIGVLIALFGTAIYVTFTKGFTATVVTPIALSVVLIILIRNWKEHKAEIKTRGL
jgi:hypothetical protein